MDVTGRKAALKGGKNMKKRSLIMMLLILVLTVALAAGEKTVEKTFDAKKLVEIKTVSGDCRVMRGAAGKVQVKLVYEYDSDCFKPEFIEEDARLVLKEDFYRSGSCSGHSDWTVQVPEKTDIRFVSASGDFVLENVDGALEVKVASGDIRVMDATGDFEVKTASGDIEVRNLSGSIVFMTASGDVEGEKLDGTVKLKTASGNVDAVGIKGEVSLVSASGDVKLEDAQAEISLKTASGSVKALSVTVTGASEFKCASGDVLVKLAKTADFDLTLASASGDAVLDYNGNTVKGAFEFSARVKDGRIVSPFNFDEEEVVTRYRRDKYHVKRFSRNGEKPVITIKTSSGKAELKK
jgi:DUF4097 and DUF4098 domain-containing protein YvlB